MMLARSQLLFAVLSLALGCSGAIGDGNFEKTEPAPDPTTEEPTPGENPPPEDPGEGPTEQDAGGSPATDSSAPATDSGAAATDTATPPPADTSPAEPPVSGLPLVPNLAISEVAFFQGVKVAVAKSGAKVTTRVADVVAGREALVRVYVTPRAGWSPREVLGELKLVSASGTRTITASLTPSAASTDGSLTSTLNFQVPTGAIAVDTQYVISLFAKSGAASGDTTGARYPQSGTPESLDAKSTGEVLRVKLVPVQYNADGTGRLPDTSPAQIERYRRAFYAMYPAKQVEITVRAPFAWSSTVSANGSGFSSLLQALVKLRQTDGAPKDVYYHGIFASRDSFSSYCSGGCVTGLCGLLTYPSDSTGRACVGVGYAGASSADTAAHEIGHAHGRAHAPCGTGDADSKYPYSGGSIGSWGYDLIDKKLYSPSSYKDFMGYCSPTWISDYTYKAIATRMATVAASAFVVSTEAAPRSYRFVDVGEGGRLSWGDRITLNEPPLAEPHTVKYVDERGEVLESATGFYYPYDDLPGGYLLVPEGPVTAAAITVSGLAAGVEARLSRLP